MGSYTEKQKPSDEGELLQLATHDDPVNFRCLFRKETSHKN